MHKYQFLKADIEPWLKYSFVKKYGIPTKYIDTTLYTNITNNLTTVRGKIKNFKLRGNTYQDSTMGVQLANFNSAYYSSAEHEIVNGKVDLSEITSSRGVTFKFDEITLPAGDYCFAFNPLTKGSNTSNQQIGSLNATFHFMPSGYSYCDFTLTEETTLSQFGFWYAVAYAGIIENIILFSGTHENIPNWEKYTGGNPAPNPDYPQDIQVVSGNNTITISNNDDTQEQVYPINLGVENLYDISTYPVGVVSATRVGNLTRMPLKKGTYTFSYKGGDEMYYMIYDSSTGGNKIKETSWASGAITFTLDNDYYFTYRIRKSNDANISPSDISKIQIEEGEKANSYSPYGITPIELCKIPNTTYEDYIRKSTGKNLFDINTLINPRTTRGIEMSIVNNSMLKLNGTSTQNNLYFTADDNNKVLLKSGTYTFTTNASVNVQLQLKKAISGTTFNINKNSTFTLDEDSYIYNGLIFTVNGTTYNETIWFQIEEGSQVTYWEPYGKKWYKYGAIGKVVLDGSESGWTREDGNDNYRDFRISISDIALVNTEPIGYISNKFISKNRSYWNEFSEHLVQMDNKKLSFRIDVSRLTDSTLASWITWLSNHNVEVRYVLETPEITEITDSTLISQLDAIENSMCSYKDQTNITVETNINTTFDLSYKTIDS